MEKLIELYEMVSLNEAALRGSENAALLKARLALDLFEQAMEGFIRVSGAAAVAAESGSLIAA
jgi:hypothetical protein